MAFEKKRLSFNKAQRRAYRDVIRDIKNMDEGKPVGKNKIILTPPVIRGRIRHALLEVEGVKQKTAVDWANRIYQRAQNFLKRRREYVIKQTLREKIKSAHPTKTAEQIDIYLEIVYRRAMMPSKAQPLPKQGYSPEVAAVHAARKAERRRVVDANRHMRHGDQMPKKKKTSETVF